MAEIFGMQVSMKIVPENIPQVQKQVADAMKKIPAGIGRTAGGLARGAQSALGGVGGAVGGATRAIGGAAKGAAGAIAGGASMGAALAGIGAAVGAAVVVLKQINDRIKKMMENLAKASQEFASSKDLLDKMWNVALRPIGNLMATLMRPYLIMSMQYLRPRLAQAQQILQEAGANPTEEQIQQIQDIFKGTAEGLLAIQQSMFSVIKPIAAEVEGFLTASKLLFNTWLVGLKGWFSGLADGFRAAFSALPDELAQSILNGLISGEQTWAALPEDMKSRFVAWLSENPEAIKSLPNELRNQITGWISENQDDLKGLADDVNDAFGASLMNETGLTDMSLLPGLVAAVFFETLTDTTGMTALKDVGVYLASVIKDNLTPTEEQKTSVTSTWQSIVDWVKGIWNKLKNFSFGGGGGGDDGAQTGMFSVPKDMMVQVHRGEQIVPATRANQGGGIINLTQRTIIQGGINKDVDIDSVVRRSSRMTELLLRRRGLIV